MPKLVLFCLSLLLLKPVFAFSLFDKTFKNFDECTSFVTMGTNDANLKLLAINYGCVNSYEPSVDIVLPDGIKVQFTIKNRSVLDTVNELIRKYPSSFNQYLAVMQIPNGSTVNVPKGILPSEVWRDVAKNNPSQMAPILSFPEPNKQNGKFGLCLINDLKSATSESTKMDLVIKCGDRADFPRAKTLELSDMFSSEKRLREQMEDAYRRSNMNNLLQNKCQVIPGSSVIGVSPFITCN